MPSRVYKCEKCAKTRMIEWTPPANPRCPCGSQNLMRVALPPSSPQAKAAAPVVIHLPPTAPASRTAIPAPPPIAGYTPPRMAAPRPGAPTLLEAIKASKVGLLDEATGARYANHDAMQKAAFKRYWDNARSNLPPSAVVNANTREAVSEFVRTVVDNCKVNKIPDRQVDMFFRGRKYFLKNRIVIDLQLPLADMAAGKCRPAEHANSNRSFGNMARDLPTRVGGEAVSYLEFGWLLRVPPGQMKVSRPRVGDPIDYIDVVDEHGRDAPFSIKAAIGRRIKGDGGTMEAGLRLVISSWGHLFFTDTHYRSFLIYDPSEDKWRPYGTTKRADESWYKKGAESTDWILPPSAPGYY